MPAKKFVVSLSPLQSMEIDGQPNYFPGDEIKVKAEVRHQDGSEASWSLWGGEIHHIKIRFIGTRSI